MKINFNCGGAKIIDRIITAYGFKTKLQLCNHLGLSSANLSMRYKRDFFPSDLVVRCMAETNAPLEWLVTGQGSVKDELKPLPLNYIQVKSSEIIQGKLVGKDDLILDNSLLPKESIKPEIIRIDNCFYIVTYSHDDVFSGKYLVEIEGRVGIYDLQRYPINMLKISGDGLLDAIDCKLGDVTVLAKVVGSFTLYNS